MQRTGRILFPLLGIFLATPAFAAHSEVVKPLKIIIGSVRYNRDASALRYFASEEQGKRLLGPSWDKATPAQRKEFVALFQQLFARTAFPRLRADFVHLQSITYETPKVTGQTATVHSTVLILHPLKKEEFKLEYALVHRKSGWKVVDVTVMGQSMIKSVRDHQIQPLIAKKGISGLLKAMRERAKEMGPVGKK